MLAVAAVSFGIGRGGEDAVGNRCGIGQEKEETDQCVMICSEIWIENGECHALRFFVCN